MLNDFKKQEISCFSKKIKKEFTKEEREVIIRFLNFTREEFGQDRIVWIRESICCEKKQT